MYKRGKPCGNILEKGADGVFQQREPSQCRLVAEVIYEKEESIQAEGPADAFQTVGRDDLFHDGLHISLKGQIPGSLEGESAGVALHEHTEFVAAEG